MVPRPLDSDQTLVNLLPQEGIRGGSITLGMLIDFIIQRTYHELTVLAELLPRKTDIERKIEIYNYSARTRQLFVRLLALVKWANSASKVDKSAHIMGFLDKQSLLFVDTADMLARMSRDTLVHARLPNFHIPSAIEVLTTGTFSKLPTCIRERIVPPDPITPSQKRTTLARLNQVIQHRLVTGNLIPNMKNPKIENGCVTFTIAHEFRVSLTTIGDGPNVPWRLLGIDILVEDKETGDGKMLVHPLQVDYIHQVIQTRLVDHPTPLTEVYSCLHFFCQSLQLEVLYSQAIRLSKFRLDNHIHIDDYFPGKHLVLSYWRELTYRDPRSELGYRLTVQVDTNDPTKPLTVVHLPSLTCKETKIADRAIRSDILSLERLLIHTIYVRTRSRLSDLKQELQNILKDVECQLQGSPAILSVPVLQPCLRAEQLLVTVETHTGMLQCHVPQYDAPLIPELTQALNNDHSKLPRLISELRFWITQRRCEKTLQHLPAMPHERLSFIPSIDNPLASISRHRMFVRLHRHPNVLLIVEFKEKENIKCEIDYSFHLAQIKYISIEDEKSENSKEIVPAQATDETAIETEYPKMYIKITNLIEFDTFVITHGPYTIVDDIDKFSLKRKRTKQPAYFIPELAHVVAQCDERLPFVTLARELANMGIPHQGLQIEANATSMVLRLVRLRKPDEIDAKNPGWIALLKRLLSVCIRVNGKAIKNWIVEFVFYGSPVTSTHPKEQGLRRPIYFQYEIGAYYNVFRTIDHFLNDWAEIVHLYILVEELAEYFRIEKFGLSNAVIIKSYSYSKLVMGYGPDRAATVTVNWDSKEKIYKLILGSSSNIINPHSLMKEQLEAHLNRNKNLGQIVHLLHETYLPLASISKLPSVPQLGVYNNRPQVPVMVFTIIPQSPTLLRIAYQGVYCLEVKLRGNGCVSVRDGAYSRFDRSNVVEEFTPTQGLKSFLSKYIDESTIYRRRSQSEDDNPPSPVTMDSESGNSISFLTSHHRGPQSPAQRDGGLRFHPPLTPPSGSNPHTPASPHPTISQTNHQSFGSSPATSFNLASPPSLPATINPSPSMLPHPSPGGLLANSPSNPLHVPSPAGLMPTSSPGPCNSVQVGHSPAGAFIQTGHMDGSPFPSSQSMASPATSNWPGSPSMPRPSPARPGQSPGQHNAMHSPQAEHNKAGHLARVLPQRSWAGAVPTLLAQEALEMLCSPSPHPQGLPGPELSPLERFLGCVYMRRQLQRFIHSEDCMISLSNNEPGVVHFRVDSLQCRVGLNTQHMQSLHIKITPIPEQKDQWSPEEIQILEKFFDSRAAAPPFKPNSLSCFARLLNAPFNCIKDIIQIMKLDLIPGLIQQQQFKWTVQWCLRIPPSATIVPPGMAGVMVCRNKILFFLQMSRIGGNPYPPSSDFSLILPLVYDISTNLTQLAEKREPGTSSAHVAASHQLKRFAEFSASSHECSLFPSVRDLLQNLTLPSDQQNQVASSPVATPNMQMHSPMGNLVMAPQPGGGPGGPPQTAMQTQPPYQGMPMPPHSLLGPQ